jgi:hypothetical protein
MTLWMLPGFATKHCAGLAQIEGRVQGSDRDSGTQNAGPRGTMWANLSL